MVGLGLVLAAALLAIIGVAVSLPPLLAGVALLFCVLCFAISHGAFNVGYDDLLAKTILEAARGRLVAHRAALGGTLTLLISLAILIFLPEVQGNEVELLWLAVVGWIVVVVAYAGLREPPSQPIRNPITLTELSRGFNLIGSHPWLRRLLIGRALLLSVELAIPFYAIHAATLHDPTAQNLTVFVVATGIGVILSGFFWAGTSNFARMVGGAQCALIAGVLTFIIDAVEDWQIPYFHALVFTLLTLGEQGHDLGRDHLHDGSCAGGRSADTDRHRQRADVDPRHRGRPAARRRRPPTRHSHAPGPAHDVQCRGHAVRSGRAQRLAAPAKASSLPPGKRPRLARSVQRVDVGVLLLQSPNLLAQALPA